MKIIIVGIFFYCYCWWYNVEKSIDIFLVEMKHYLFTIFYFYKDSIVSGIEPFLVDHVNVWKKNAEVYKLFIFECFDAHMIISFSIMFTIEH